jgi:hypothetical protein
MNIYKKRAALRIGLVSLLLAILGSPLAWLISRENAEEEVVLFAIEESRRPLAFLNDGQIDTDNARQAQNGANILTSGIFDIAEVYDAQGKKLAEQMTPTGSLLENQLPHHARPDYQDTHYENNAISLEGEKERPSVFVPLFDKQKKLSGYFEVCA